MRSITGTLPYGLEVDGVVHAEYEMRAAVLNDNIEAIDEVGASENNLKLSAAILARQITRLGTLDPTKITGKLLGQLDIEDWNELDRAASEVAKKSPPPKRG